MYHVEVNVTAKRAPVRYIRIDQHTHNKCQCDTFIQGEHDGMPNTDKTYGGNDSVIVSDNMIVLDEN